MTIPVEAVDGRTEVKHLEMGWGQDWQSHPNSISRIIIWGSVYICTARPIQKTTCIGFDIDAS
jgi:hypothetical protein